MAIKTLIVIDTGNNFNSTDYTILSNSLTDAGIDVDTAFIGDNDPSTGAGGHVSDASDFQNFNFATSIADLSVYDVIWIFGYHSSTDANVTLAPEEINALARFMDAGGGVFATGDHEALGSRLCGYIPRVRTMRAWFDDGNKHLSPMRDTFPLSFDRNGAARADTIVRPGTESDNIAQTIDPLSSPAHPILRKDGNDITSLPDHMHEGNTLGDGGGGLIAADYTQGFGHDAYNGGAIPAGFVEFPSHDTFELPQVVAQRTIDGTDIDGLDSKTINLLSAYDGFKAGVGRVVTGSTCHHYHNFNLNGFAAGNSDFDDIKTAFVNITEWLAKPEPRMQLIVERSTFSEDEVNSNSTFAGAILVTVDGLAPSHFVDGPINTSNPSQTLLEKWAPEISVLGMENITIKPRGPLFSDDPSFYNRLQRFTFQYDIEFTNPAETFNFDQSPRMIAIEANLQSNTGVDISKNAVLQLTKSSNPFMLDSVAGETPHWLSTDVRSFQVTANTSFLGKTLSGTNQDAAIAYLQSVLGDMTYNQFENELEITQQESALYAFPKNDDDVNVFNFAIARVRLHPDSANAENVRVFFRIFTSQSTALEYATHNGDLDGTPIRGYLEANNAGGPIAVPGITANGSEWLSFPFFGEKKKYAQSPETQTDSNNVKPIMANDEYAFFGVLIDNNRNQAYLRDRPTDPVTDPKLPLMDHLMGEHQCLVAQIEYEGTPIPSGSLPSNSDKLSQRNLAFSAVANPGLNSSRVAMHTFEVQPSTSPITDKLAPDELLLDWVRPAPKGTMVKIYVPSWDADEVVALADRFYVNHGVQKEDQHTVSVPSDGMRYVPIPRSLSGQTGVIMAELPLGIKKGQRFDLSVRQISNTSFVRREPKAEFVELNEKEVIRLYSQIQNKGKKSGRVTIKKLTETGVPRGIFEINANEKLVTDKAIFDEGGKGGFLIKQDAKAVAAARRKSFYWRTTVGSFQLGIPVSVKEDMLNHHIRLLSVFRWRLERLNRNSRWFKTLSYYVNLLAEKVQGLGGNPYLVPITPDGDPNKLGILPTDKDQDGEEEGGGLPPVKPGGKPKPGKGNYFEPGLDDWLGGTKGLPDPKKAKPIMLTGKISGVLHDHFGDFEGFILEAYDGQNYQFYSKESAILELVELAKASRRIVTVVTTTKNSRHVRRLLLS